METLSSPSTITVEKYMTKLPFTISKEESLHKAKKLMEYIQSRHLPVLENGHVVGMLSDRDLRTGLANENSTVGDICSNDPYFVSADTALQDICTVMEERKIGSVMILKHEKVVGIFTWIDALRALKDLLPPLS